MKVETGDKIRLKAEYHRGERGVVEAVDRGKIGAYMFTGRGWQPFRCEQGAAA